MPDGTTCADGTRLNEFTERNVALLKSTNDMVRVLQELPITLKELCDVVKMVGKAETTNLG